MEKTLLKDLKEDIVYSMVNAGIKYIAKRNFKAKNDNYINTSSKHYSTGEFNEYNWEEASYQDAQWLLKCIEQGRYIPLDQINLEHSYLIHN